MTARIKANMNSELIEEKLNDIRVKPVIPSGNEPLPDKIKGYDHIPGLYANVFICAKKKSGKTNVIFNLLKALTKTRGDSKTGSTVYFFVSTIHKDPTYDEIKDMLTKRRVRFEIWTHFIDDSTGDNMISELLKSDHNPDQPKVDYTIKEVSQLTAGGDRIIRQIKIPKSMQSSQKDDIVEPEKIFVFDDLGSDLRHPAINQLLKTNRHHKAKVIISSQYLTDLQPQAIKQLDFALLFKSFNDEKLQKIYDGLDLGVTFDDFKVMYKYATSESFSFLFIDVRKEVFRKNFSTQISIRSQ